MTTIVAAPPQDDPLLVLHLIASGVVHLSEQAGEGKPLKLPYPATLQRGLDTLSVLCLRAGMAPPRSVPDLLAWCTRPLDTWPVALDAEVVGAGDRLVDHSTPTRACEEWAMAGADVEAEVVERRLLLDVLSICRGADAQDAYVAFRRLLIDHPVLTALEVQVLIGQRPLGLLADHVRRAYRPAPPEALIDGGFVCCDGCGNLLIQNEHGRPTCAEERCRRADVHRPGRTLNPRAGVLWLDRALRTFIAAPGRAELRLARRLQKRGLEVELWPSFDAYDLRVVFPEGRAWAVDVKDWANPFLLGRQVHPIPPTPAWDRAFFVFPQDRLRRPDYLRAVLGGSPPTEALMERTFLKRVDQALGDRHA